MKRVIKELLAEIRVEVLVDRYYVPVQVTSSIDPVQPNYPIDKSIDEQALADYDSFIEDSREEIESMDREIVEQNKSNKSPTSRYFTLVDLTQHVEHSIQYMIFLRISDHFPTDTDDEEHREIDQAIRQHRDSTKARLSAEQGHRVVWKVRQIIVNGERYSSYDEALDRVRQLVREWSQLLQSHPFA